MLCEILASFQLCGARSGNGRAQQTRICLNTRSVSLNNRVFHLVTLRHLAKYSTQAHENDRIQRMASPVFPTATTICITETGQRTTIAITTTSAIAIAAVWQQRSQLQLNTTMSQLTLVFAPSAPSCHPPPIYATPLSTPPRCCCCLSLRLRLAVYRTGSCAADGGEQRAIAHPVHTPDPA